MQHGIGLAAGRLIGTYDQVTGTIIGQLHPVQHHGAIDGLDRGERRDIGHIAWSTGALSTPAAPSARSTVASVTTDQSNSCEPISVRGSGKVGAESNDSRNIVPESQPSATFPAIGEASDPYTSRLMTAAA